MELRTQLHNTRMERDDLVAEIELQRRLSRLTASLIQTKITVDERSVQEPAGVGGLALLLRVLDQQDPRPQLDLWNQLAEAQGLVHPAAAAALRSSTATATAATAQTGRLYFLETTDHA